VRTDLRTLGRSVVVLVALLGSISAPAAAQQRPGQPLPPLSEERPVQERRAAEREHFQIKVGPSYDQGDFGTSDITRTLFIPVTVRYLGERFDVGVTSSWIRLDAPKDVKIVDGQPNRTGGEAGERAVHSGIGDFFVRGRYYLVDDPGPGSWIPSFAPFAKLKFPTADEDKGLGTGHFDHGLGFEWDKTFGQVFIFGDASYTIMGGKDFRDRPAASVGIGYTLSPQLTVSGMLDWRRAVVKDSPNHDPLELVGLLTVKLSRTLSVTPNFFVGLTNGSPDWGLGFEMSWKFGRW
jgi:hypothetical protein